MRSTARIIRACLALSIPCALENPASSLLLHAPPIERLIKQGGRVNITDFCQHGARWRKRTAIVAWLTPFAPRLNVRGDGRKGVCSKTLLPHIVLAGCDRSSGKLWTQVAEPYPGKFAAAAADLLVAAACFNGYSRQLDIISKSVDLRP